MKLAWARSDLTRLEDTHSRRRDWIPRSATTGWRLRLAIAIVLVVWSLGMFHGVRMLGRRAVNAWNAPPPTPESLAAVDLGCPLEDLSARSYGEHQRVVTGCGKCAVYASPPGGLFGWGRVDDPGALQYACGR